eukprot:m.59115 g.59115  ORF g.59115 m.59115 type:complete len:173 (-) comp17300_c0_seq1:657-1175(-)
MDQQHHPDRRDIDRQPMKRARQEDGDYREALEDDEIDGPRLPPAAVADQPEMEMVVRAEAEEDDGNAMDEDAHAARAPPPPSEPLSYNGGGVVVVDEVADGGGPPAVCHPNTVWMVTTMSWMAKASCRGAALRTTRPTTRYRRTTPIAVVTHSLDGLTTIQINELMRQSAKG